MLNFGDIRACLVHMIENMCFVVWLKFKWICCILNFGDIRECLVHMIEIMCFVV